MVNLKICSHDEDFLPSTLILLLNELRNIWAKNAYETENDDDMQVLSNEELDDHLLSIFTPFDMVLNPRFRFFVNEYDDKWSTLRQSLIIECHEIKQNFIQEVIVELK